VAYQILEFVHLVTIFDAIVRRLRRPLCLVLGVV
jgi:hypothetical protein